MADQFHRTKQPKKNLIPLIPEYDKFEHLVAVSSPVYTQYPIGVAIEESTGNIYVAYHSGNVKIFSKDGDFLKKFGISKWLFSPYGILIHEGSVFVTEWDYHTLLQFSLADYSLINKFQGFNHPRQLAMSPDKELYVADSFNDRVKIMFRSRFKRDLLIKSYQLAMYRDEDLSFNDRVENLALRYLEKDLLIHATMTHPVDVKFATDRILVLSSKDKPCLHIFTLAGEKIGSVISGIGQAYFFCLDGNDNIIISDNSHHKIKIFSPGGKLLRTFGEDGDQLGALHEPRGIAILNLTKLVCISMNRNYHLQIFSY